MATFSQGFLANLGRPAMTESLFDLGTAIGRLPGQAVEAKKRKELMQYDPATYQGQIQILTAQMRQEKDPVKRAELGRSLLQFKEAQKEQARSEAVIVATEDLANQLVALGDEVGASLLRSGAITASTGRQYLRNITLASQGEAARNKLIEASNVGDTAIVKQIGPEGIQELSDGQFSALLRVAEDERDKNIRVANLRKMGADDIAEAHKNGIYTAAQVGQLMVARSQGQETKISNRKTQIYDGKVVFTADVSRPGEDEFIGYYDVNTQNWMPITDAGKIQDVSEKVNKIRKQDLDFAGIYLTQKPGYADLELDQKQQAQLQFAFIAQELIDSNQVKSSKEAYEQALGKVDITKTKNWVDWVKGLFPSSDLNASNIQIIEEP